MSKTGIFACCGQIIGHSRWCQGVSPSGISSLNGRAWLQTYTGKKFFPLDPDPALICIEDIAHSLAMQVRYTGHCQEFYSVGQHSVLLSSVVFVDADRVTKLQALLHDASEAYLSDIPGPLKVLPQFAFYREAEDRLQKMINLKFGLPGDGNSNVRLADKQILIDESEAPCIMAPRHPDWNLPPTNPHFRHIKEFDPWPWSVTERRFLRLFNQLFYRGSLYETDYMRWNR